MKKLSFVKPDLFLPNVITIVGSSKNILKKKMVKKFKNQNLLQGSIMLIQKDLSSIQVPKRI